MVSLPSFVLLTVGGLRMRKPVFLEPMLHERHLPLHIQIKATPVLDRVNILAHPFLRQDSVVNMVGIKPFRTYNADTDISKIDIASGVAITVDIHFLGVILERNERL